MAAFLALGSVSLLADVVYEGGRSVFGPLLATLGAPALAAALAVYGEAAAYAGRALGGLVASLRPGKAVLAALMALGYGLNIAVPLLALAGSWEAALALYVVERVGKGLRAPVRDTLIAGLGPRGRRGLLFGAYELMDQAGAVAGPLLVARAVAEGGVRGAYAALAVPYAASMAVLALALTVYPWAKLEVGPRPPARGAARAAAVGVVTAAPYAAYVHWAPASLMAFEAGEPPEGVATAYALAMAADAAAAPLLGAAYDRLGARLVLALPALCFAGSALLLAGPGLVAGAVLWGVAMAGLETVPRAAIADSVAAPLRPAAYASYYLASALLWGASSAASVLAGAAAPYALAAGAAVATAALASLLPRMTRLSRAEPPP